MKKLFVWMVLGISYSNLIAQSNLKIANIDKALFWENNPLNFSIHKNSLQITAGEKTDMFRDPNVTYNTDNAPKLMFEAEESFVLSATISHGFLSKWDGGAIVLKSDSLNWVKFCFEKDYTGAKRVVSVVTKGISDDCNSIESSLNSMKFKIAKADNVITLYCWVKNKWLLVRHLQFDTPKKYYVGFLAQSPTGQSCTVKFSDIQYEVKKIKDPYTGI